MHRHRYFFNAPSLRVVSASYTYVNRVYLVIYPMMSGQYQDISSVDKESFDYVFEQNVTIPLKSSEGIVRCNVYRPKDESKQYPVLVTYGPCEYHFPTGCRIEARVFRFEPPLPIQLSDRS